MSTPMKPWENTLENNGHILKNSNLPQVPGAIRSTPLLPPRPQTMSYNNGYSSYSPLSSFGSSYGGYGGYNSMPYRSSMYGGGYNSYGTGSYGMYGMGTGYGTGYGPGYGIRDDAETRFVQFAEERSRNTFANVESIVRAFNSMAMMLDNTFFAMTSSFRAVLGVAENFGRLRSMFGHVWHALNIFRLFKWLYRRMMGMAGVQVSGGSSVAWREAINGGAAEAAGSGGSSWPTLAFIGVLLSAPYFISKWLPKYEDKLNPEHWKQSGIPAKAVFDFAASSQNELTLHTNDDVLLAPKTVQEEMKLTNSGWAYAACNGRSGVVPLNYIVIKRRSTPAAEPPVPHKPQKRVSFGENQIFEMKKEEEEQPTNKDIDGES